MINFSIRIIKLILTILFSWLDNFELWWQSFRVKIGSLLDKLIDFHEYNIKLGGLHRAAIIAIWGLLFYVAVITVMYWKEGRK